MGAGLEEKGFVTNWGIEVLRSRSLLADGAVYASKTIKTFSGLEYHKRSLPKVGLEMRRFGA